MKPLIRRLIGAAVAIVALAAWAQDRPQVEIHDISQTVVKMSLQGGVSIEDASAAMMSKAAELNWKLVGRQEVHAEIRARGEESPHLEILQFCDPDDAVKMVRIDPIYSAYMPCRIALVEDTQGRPWLFMLNLDMLINNTSLPNDLQELAIRVNQAMLIIMTAGATGEF
ncbi:MAG: DUF302 domain-containing protein [Thiocapsa sp.]|uniref:DUF302 domain-containing protein n=1 Tax=Thiocapsa sp. TaxID=2024551 RepID=UPI001BCB013B|nr:DUF302 domain-containing protein [Thiocapsa sp.]QVL49932.1 MAG: DUF302 domain-containing protein [Thiocapsa sp.]